MKPVFYFALGALLTGCVGIVKIQGTVIDHQTKQRLPNVMIECLNYATLKVPTRADSVQNQHFYFRTDELGHFSIQSGYISTLFHQKFKLKLMKDGYQTLKTRKSGTVFIELNQE